MSDLYLCFCLGRAINSRQSSLLDVSKSSTCLACAWRRRRWLCCELYVSSECFVSSSCLVTQEVYRSSERRSAPACESSDCSCSSCSSVLSSSPAPSSSPRPTRPSHSSGTQCHVTGNRKQESNGKPETYRERDEQ